jgi:general stress protein YciG
MAEKSSRKSKDSKETSADGQRVREAYQKLGHMGGEAVKEKYGPEFYSQIGKKGGDTVKGKYGPEFYHTIGEKGGEARKSQLGHSGYQ